MKFAAWLKAQTEFLAAAGIKTARLDCLVLAEDTLKKDRAWLLAHPDTQLTATQTEKLKKLLKRRAGHEPLAYVRGKTEFYGRQFLVNHDVLEPRPESENIIDLLKIVVSGLINQTASGSPISLLDVGTGSGALGITAALELPKCQVTLLDIDAKALKVAKTNVDKFTLNISIIQNDLLQNNDFSYHILLCNLPYVPDEFHINTAASKEPKLAIFGGPDGLDIYRQLFKQLASRQSRPLYILTEALPPQHGNLSLIANAAGYKLEMAQDFVQVFKNC